MIKSISFCKEFIPIIKSGKKTVTRRIKSNLKREDICYFKSGRLGKKQGYLKIIEVNREKLHRIGREEYGWNRHKAYKDYLDEGMKSVVGKYDSTYYMSEEFITIWDRLNKNGFKWEDNPNVYRIEFKYLGEKIK